MIGRLSGTLAGKSPGSVLVDVQGVGYRVLVPLSTFYALPAEGERATLEVSTQVREDAIQLFGFATARERELFELLITVSRIGPKLAVAILSGVAVGELAAAIAAGDAARLGAVPGVGAKTAERLVLELRGKVVPPEAREHPAAPPGLGVEERRAVDDAVEALVGLGYRARDAERAVGRAAREGEAALEALIRRALAILSQ